MNSSGGTSPRVGWFQRTSASTPVTGDVTGRQGDLGLVVQLELARVQGSAQRCEQAEPVGRVAVAGGVVHLDAGVLLLGQVHRDVGAMHELFDVGAVVGVDRDPDARLELEQHVLELERLDERVAHPTGDVGGVRCRRQLRHDDGELVAAQAGDEVVLAAAPLGCAARPSRAAGRRRGGRGCR